MLTALFFTFFKIGLFTFGGGYAMIAGIREVVLEKKKWLSEEELLQVITIAESTPGPIAINLATYVGYRKKGFLGSVAATLGVIVPSFTIIFLLSLFLDRFMANEYIAYAFAGIKCGVAFLILKAGFNMLEKIKKQPLPLTIFLLVFALLIIFELTAINFSSIILIVIGGILGLALYSGKEKKEEKK